MNVNAVGQSDSTDIRKAAIESAMLDKEPSDAEVIKWIFETFPNPDYSPKQALARLCADRLEAAAAQIKSQAERIAELEKDAKRLDWMDATAFTAYHHRDAEHGNLNLYSVVVNEDAENRIGRTGPFIREAIDAVMNERKE